MGSEAAQDAQGREIPRPGHLDSFFCAPCATSRLTPSEICVILREPVVCLPSLILRVKNPIPFLRYVAFAEATSFLILLFVAMPLKYFAGLPLAVKIVGLAHGLLFLLLCFALVRVMRIAQWPLARVALIFVAALLPFGPFVVDRRMRAYKEEFPTRGPAA